MMKNEIILVESIEKRLRKVREPPIFPLSPTHRKELRELRNRNIGNLRERLSTIKSLKLDEYEKKHFAKIEKKLAEKEKICKMLNDDFEKIIKNINNLLSERKKFEDKFDIKFLKLSNDYGNVANLDKLDVEKRRFSFEKKNVIHKIAEDDFEKKYGIRFDEVQKKIDDIVTKYEEAINFGDLEIVKELYYIMKTADSFFTKISELNI